MDKTLEALFARTIEKIDNRQTRRLAQHMSADEHATAYTFIRTPAEADLFELTRLYHVMQNNKTTKKFWQFWK